MASENLRRPLILSEDDGGNNYDEIGTDSDSPIRHTRTSTNFADEPRYKTYRKRWFMLAVVSLLNLSNAAIWITFSPIANITATYYHVDLMGVDWLSLIYMVVFIPFSLCSAWLVDTLGLRISILVGTWLNAVGAGLRLVSAFDFVSPTYSFPILLLGQGLAAVVQPIAMIAPVKVAALWFAADQRGIATTIGTMSNPLGILIANFISPQIINGEPSRMIWLMLVFAIPPAISAVLATGIVCHSVPPTPPSRSADTSTEPFFKGLKQLIRLPMYWVLAVCFGIGMGVATALTTLIQQILCPNGYTDNFSGICGGLFITFGILLAGVTGLIIDKWKIFEETTKVYLCLAALSYIALAELVRFPGLEVAVAAAISFAGMFTFPLFPLCLELAVESSYPVAEATSSSCIIMLGQVSGIIIILMMQSLTTDMPPNYEFSDINCNEANSTSPNLDYTNSNLTLVGILVLAVVIFMVFYRAEYRRIKAEQRIAAAKILQYPSLDRMSSSSSRTQGGGDMPSLPHTP